MTFTSTLLVVAASASTTLLMSTIRFRVMDRRYYRRQIKVMEAAARFYPAAVQAMFGTSPSTDMCNEPLIHNTHQYTCIRARGHAGPHAISITQLNNQGCVHAPF
jgi:hypothetical protein